MTYSIYFHYHGMTMKSIKKSDCLDAGMLEWASDDVYVWHDIKEKDLCRVVKYIGMEFDVPMVEITKEYYVNFNFCKTETECTVFYTENTRN